MKAETRLLRYAGLALLGAAALIALIMWSPAANELTRPLFIEPEECEADVIVVLGAGIYPDGELSWFSLLRTLKGVALYRNGYARKVLFSGYAGREALMEGRSLARSMAAVAAGLGVPEEDILLEDRSRRTHENALRSRAVMRREGFQTALLVTSAMHMRRAMLTFERAGLRVFPAPVSPVEASVDDPIERLLVFRAAVREYLGLAFYRSRGWI